jgi:hypothetical protein
VLFLVNILFFVASSRLRARFIKQKNSRKTGTDHEISRSILDAPPVAGMVCISVYAFPFPVKGSSRCFARDLPRFQGSLMGHLFRWPRQARDRQGNRCISGINPIGYFGCCEPSAADIRRLLFKFGIG